MSKFAQERAKQSTTSEKEKTDGTFSSGNIIIGNIVERKEGVERDRIVVENLSFDDSEGFPKPKRIDKKVFHYLRQFLNFFINQFFFSRLNSNQQRKAKVFLLNFIQKMLNRARVHQNSRNQI